MLEQRARMRSAAAMRAAAMLGLAVTTAGCPSKEEPPPPPVDNGIETPMAIAPTGSFWAPFDSTPSPDGATVYFIAQNANGSAIYSVAATGGTPALLFEGEPLAAPTSIVMSTDGATLYLADSGAADDMDRNGRIFSLPASGGTPAPIGAADGLSPRGLDLIAENGSDQIYFSGIESGAPAVFKMAADGSGRSKVFGGAPLVEPGGIAATKSGVLYVADASGAADETGAIFRIEGGAATEFAADLRLAFPAGIALTMDESVLLVSALDRGTETSVVYSFDLASGMRTANTAGIATTTEPAGLHRAHNARVYSWADANGREEGTAGQGAVYLVKSKGE